MWGTDTKHIADKAQFFLTRTFRVKYFTQETEQVKSKICLLPTKSIFRCRATSAELA